MEQSSVKAIRDAQLSYWRSEFALSISRFKKGLCSAQFLDEVSLCFKNVSDGLPAFHHRFISKKKSYQY